MEWKKRIAVIKGLAKTLDQSRHYRLVNGLSELLHDLEDPNTARQAIEQAEALIRVDPQAAELYDRYLNELDNIEETALYIPPAGGPIRTPGVLVRCPMEPPCMVLEIRDARNIPDCPQHGMKMIEV